MTKAALAALINDSTDSTEMTVVHLTMQERRVVAACIAVALTDPATTVNEGRALMDLWTRVHPDTAEEL